MWELDYKESWALKNWWSWTVVLEKTLESPLDCKEIQPVHPKGDQSCIFIGRTDAEAETPILWPSDVKSWLIWKNPDARKDWGQEEKGTTLDERDGWHHGVNGHAFEWTLWVGDGHGAWRAVVHKAAKSLTTYWLNWTEPTQTSTESSWGWREGQQEAERDSSEERVLMSEGGEGVERASRHFKSGWGGYSNCIRCGRRWGGKLNLPKVQRYSWNLMLEKQLKGTRKHFKPLADKSYSRTLKKNLPTKDSPHSVCWSRVL